MVYAVLVSSPHIFTSIRYTNNSSYAKKRKLQSPIGSCVRLPQEDQVAFHHD